MTKQDYLNELTRHLKRLPSHEIEEIKADYREHFEMGVRAGKSEEDIAQSLGHPRTVAQGYMVNSLVDEAKSTPYIVERSKILFRIMFLILILAPFNFFVIVGPFLGLLALTVAGWAIPLAIGGASIAAVGAYFSFGLVTSMGILQNLSLLFMFLGMLGFAVMIVLIMAVITKLLTELIASYLRWNINFISARKV